MNTSEIDKIVERREAEWRTLRYWLWTQIALEATAWLAAVLLFHWFVEWLIGI